MLRRTFLTSGAAALGVATLAKTPGEKLAAAAKAQVGVTKEYDPRYVRIPYPGGDVPRVTGVCADVIVRAGRDGLGADLQRLVHEDMVRAFGEYPKTWGMTHADSNIDHRRVMNLEAYWRRTKAQMWAAKGAVAGNGFPGPLQVGDILTWRLDGRLPHIGMVVAESLLSTRVVHNWGNGAEESGLYVFAPHRAVGHYRWTGV
jgi:uncharacterized protein YijF (DUF1287 family)